MLAAIVSFQFKVAPWCCITPTNLTKGGGRLGTWSSSCSITIIVVWHSLRMHIFTYHASSFWWFQILYLDRGQESNCVGGHGRHTTVSKRVCSITHKYGRGGQWMDCYLKVSRWIDGHHCACSSNTWTVKKEENNQTCCSNEWFAYHKPKTWLRMACNPPSDICQLPWKLHQTATHFTLSV